MAKFCGNCGAPVDEHARVCGRCGAPVYGNLQTTTVQTVKPEKKKKNVWILKLAILLILATAVSVIAIQIISKFIGCNGLIRKVMAAYEDYNIDTLVFLSSDIYYYGGGDDAENYFENVVGTAHDTFESSVGHRYRLSYEVNEIYTMSERRSKETIEEIEYAYPDFDVGMIEKLRVADITVTATQDGRLEKLDVNVTMSKENGIWKLLYME